MAFNTNLKILTVCAGGNVRSVALAFLLKYHPQYQQPNTLSVGVWITPQETFDMLAQWADLIIVCGERALWDRVPAIYYPKAYHFDIGLDRWNDPLNPELLEYLKNKLDGDTILRQKLGWS